MPFQRKAHDPSQTLTLYPTSIPPRRALIAPDRAAYKWWVAVTVMLSAFLVVMSNATVNVALPPIMTAFGLNLDQAQWVITAYMIAGAVLIPTVGWLGNRLGNRNLFLLSLVVFVSSSALCGLAWSGTSLTLFRVVQGLGGGPITPMAMVLLNETFPARQRGLAMGLYGMSVSFGPAMGPVLAGYVTEHLSWRMVFYLNTVPGVVCILLAFLVLPSMRETVKRSLDLAGLLALTVFLVSLLTALSQGQRYGWDAPLIQRLLVVAGVSCIAFLVLAFTRKEPLIDLRLYKDPAFAAVSLAALIIAMAFWGTGFLQTILLQQLMGYTPAQAGFAQLPGALCMAASTLVAGRLADVLDRRYLIWCGLGMFALASYWFTSLTLDRPMSWVVWMIVARYATIGFVFTPMNAASLVLLPPERMRMGSGLLTLMQQGLGGTVGLALMTTTLQRRTLYHGLVLDQQQDFTTLGWGPALAPARELMVHDGEVDSMIDIKALALLRRHLEQHATVAAYQDCFLILAGLCVVVMPLVWFLRRRTA